MLKIIFLTFLTVVFYKLILSLTTEISHCLTCKKNSSPYGNIAVLNCFWFRFDFTFLGIFFNLTSFKGDD